MIGILVIILGLIFGSFLSACVYRIPLGRMSGIEEIEELEGDQSYENDPEIQKIEEALDIKAPNSEHFEKPVTICYPQRSFCPNCGMQLKWYHNIPFFSWLMLGGKCAGCKTSISWQYPTIELLTATFAWLSYTMFTPYTALVAFAFCCALIVLSFIDINYYLLPNVITYPAFVLGLLFALQQQFFHLVEAPPFVANLTESLLGVLTGVGILLSISFFYTFLRKREGLGMGDVKLLAVTGAFFGVQGAFYTIFVGSLVGSVVGITLILIGKGKFSNYLPFGPYLAVANLLYLFAEPELAEFFQMMGQLNPFLPK